MSHTVQDKKKLLDRVRRIRGQIEGIEIALEEERDPAEILHAIATCRGGMNGLMAQVMEGQIRLHVLDPHKPPRRSQTESAQHLIDVIKMYLK